MENVSRSIWKKKYLGLKMGLDTNISVPASTFTRPDSAEYKIDTNVTSSVFHKAQPNGKCIEKCLEEEISGFKNWSRYKFFS
ncbi:MAG TPA: hypothetical protein ENH91_00225 [Leeuwenhoekiella sp.]|nr:hypothetical protein [Leeuwenhoekiella sp.]